MKGLKTNPIKLKKKFKKLISTLFDYLTIAYMINEAFNSMLNGPILSLLKVHKVIDYIYAIIVFCHIALAIFDKRKKYFRKWTNKIEILNLAVSILFLNYKRASL